MASKLISQSRNRGSYAVEMALVMPVLLILVFGIIEVGLLFNSVVLLKSGAREGCRSAAIGASTAEIAEKAQSACTSLSSSPTITSWYRGAGETEWSLLTDTTQGEQTVNAAPAGSEVRVTLQYDHTLVASNLFPTLGESGVLTLQSSIVMRRE